MSSLFASLAASGGALSAFSRSLDVIQNNVSNASTPGYARQTMNLEALSFQPSSGLPGGVGAADLQSTRNEYAEQAVREKLQAAGQFDQQVASLSDLQNSFDISGTSGISGALNGFFQSLSAWSVNPSDTVLGGTVLDSAKTLAQSFQSAAGDVAKTSSSTDKQIGDTVDQINSLASQLQQYNVERLRMDKPDAGLDAKVHSTLEQLSQLVNFDTINQADGSVTVLLGGQTPLVIGDKQYAIKADMSTPPTGTVSNAGASAPARIRGADGADITSEVSGGKLGGLLDVRNQVLPQLIGDGTHAGDLNRLAKAVADRVNGLLTSGQVSAGPPPVAGSPIFTYDSTDATFSARSLAVDPSVDASKLAAIDPGPPTVSNGIALKLAGLSSPATSADEIDGFSYAEFYGNTAGKVGSRLAAAQDNSDTQQQVVAQARSLRDQSSGVSLDEEAVNLIEYQRAYQATAKMISVLNDLTETTVNLVK